MTITATQIPGQRAGRPDEGRESWTLVERAQAGDGDAFAELYRRHRDRVYEMAYMRTGRNHAVADDITSTTFLRAWRAVDRLEYQGRDFAAFLMVICRNLIADHFKSGAMRTQTVVTVDDDSPDGGAPMWIVPAPDPGRSAERAELAQAIETALAELTEAQARVLRLRFLLGCSVEETADAMGMSIGGVKSMQLRATRVLRRSRALAAHR